MKPGDLIPHKHFSHPHALKFHETLIKDTEDYKTICSACELQLTSRDAVYRCPKRNCGFILHKECFELPRKLEHKCHPDHPFTLLTQPPKHSLYYNCDACGDLINAFSYHCEKCDARIHVACSVFPETVECKAHTKHALAVRYNTPKPDSGITLCNVCDDYITDGYWSYRCEDCDFDSHLQCAITADYVPENEEEEEENEEGLSDAEKLAMANIKMMDQMARLQFQMNMTEMNARFKANLFRTRYY